MKNVFWGTLLLAMLGAGLSLLPVQSYDAPAESAVVLTSAEKEYLRLKRSITFISQTNYPPFEFIDGQGERRGMMIELAQWISSEIGFHARFTDAAFSAAQAAIQNGSADVLTSFFYSEERNKTFDFTQTVFHVPASIFVLADRPDITDFNDLRGKRIAMQRGDYAQEFLDHRGIDYVKVPTASFGEAASAVINGQADVVIGDEQIVLYYLYSNNLQQLLKIVGEPLYTGLNSMAVKEGHQLLQSILNKGIDHARATGMLERLNQKWIGTALPDPPETPINWWALWPYAALFAGLLVAVLLYNLHLRRVVVARTSELKRSEYRLKAVIDGTDAGAWEWNLVTNETFYNDRWAQMLGYELAELEPLTHDLWRKLLHPEDLPRAEEKIRRHCQGEISSYHCEIRLRHKQGHWVWILDRGKVYEYAADGSPLLMAGTHVDISARKQAEDVLRDSEERNRALLQAIPDLIFIMNDQGMLLACHAGDSSKLALPPDQFINRTLADVFSEDIAETAMACIAEARQTGETSTHEYQLEIADDVRWFESRIVPCGETTFLSIVRDITDRKKSKLFEINHLKNQQVLLDNIRTQVWFLTSEHQYGEVNQAHADFFGVAKEDIAFKDLYEFMPAEAVEVCKVSNGQVFRTGKATITEEQVVDGAGNMRLLQIHKSPKLRDDGAVEYVVCSAEDITERKAAELALEKKNQEMEQFVYIVSHDLKSPLVTIKTFLKMLQEDIRNNDQEQISKDLEFIHSAANKVDRLLGALLKLSRVGRVDAPATTLPVTELVDECLKILGGTLQERQVVVSVGEMPFALHGDPLHFGQIWQNLIENAVKYLGDQQQPSVEVGTRQEDKNPVFYVRDNGIGIDAEHHQQVFGIFAQLHRNSEGIGLGLALVSKLVAIYGGRIWVESEGKGKGSCFCFTLPQALRSL